MEIIDRLTSEEVWNAFLKKRELQGSMSLDELDGLRSFILSKEYLPVAEKLRRGEYVFPIPVMREINRLSSKKKRIVYTFPEVYSNILKVISFLLHEYDDAFAKNLYSFKEHTGVKNAVLNVTSKININNCFTYKVDVKNYFNSIDVSLLIPMLGDVLKDEPKLLDLITKLLSDPNVIYNDKVISDKKGVMAGLAISGFLANLYLSDMDSFFEERSIPYIRYSDDIIVFAENADDIRKYEEYINEHISKMNLEINASKVVRTSPGDPVEFLGFRFENERIDVSSVSLMKIKGKMKRKARKIYRWKIKKGVDNEKAVMVYIGFLNRKFYDKPVRDEMTWSRWYFPVITTDKSLKLIDDYALNCIRYIATGKHGKKNYALRYDDIKRMGYRNLVHEYWA